MLLERVVGCPWNDWSDVHGIGGRITVARAITNTRWNGLVFFGIKRQGTA